MGTVLVSRKFDVNSGSAEWIISAQLYQAMQSNSYDVVKIEQKVKSKIFHDWVILPMKCLLHRISGHDKFYFLSENQAMHSFWLNWTGANTSTYLYDLMRVQKEKKSLDHYYFMLVYWLATKSKTLNVISTKTGDEFCDLFGEKLRDKIVLLPPYLVEFAPNKEFRRYNVIGYLGALSNRKRPLKLIELAIYIKNNELDYKIEVWGKGPLEGQMITMIRQFQLEKYIELKGYAPEGKKEDIYNTFGYFFFPTEKEGYGLPAKEAFDCEVPVFLPEDADIPLEVRKLCTPFTDYSQIFSSIKTLKENDYG